MFSSEVALFDFIAEALAELFASLIPNRAARRIFWIALLLLIVILLFRWLGVMSWSRAFDDPISLRHGPAPVPFFEMPLNSFSEYV